jgi:hypothetical protein
MKRILFCLCFFFAILKVGYGQFPANFEGYFTYRVVTAKDELTQRNRYYIRGDTLKIVPVGGSLKEIFNFGDVLVYGKSGNRYAISHSQQKVEQLASTTTDLDTAVHEAMGDSTEVLGYRCYNYLLTEDNPFGKSRSVYWISPSIRIAHTMEFARCLEFKSTFFKNGRLPGLPLKVEMGLTNGDISILQMEELVAEKLPPNFFQLPAGYRVIKN